MTVIKATCSECELDAEVQANEFLVVIRDCGDGHYYVFRCPYCQQLARRNAEPLVINLLVSNGVRIHQLHVPQEIVEIEHIQAPVISIDDYLDFKNSLRGWTGEVS